MSKHQHWSAMSETGTKLGIQILLFIYTLFGRKGFRLLLRPVIFYYWLFSRKHRQASNQYLQKLKATYPAIANDSKLNSFNHLTYFAESLLHKIMAWKGNIQLSDLHFHLPPQLADKGDLRSVMLLGSHLGDLELCRALSTQIPNIKVTALVFTKHAMRFNEILKEYQSAPQGEFDLLQVDEISPATLILLQQRIEEGHIIVIVGDRTSIQGQSQNNSYRTTFLGEEADFPQGPYILAHLLKVPVYLIFALRHSTEVGKFDLYLEHFADQVHLPRKARETNGVQPYVEKYVKRLEHYCQHSPLEWFNFYDFWRK